MTKQLMLLGMQPKLGEVVETTGKGVFRYARVLGIAERSDVFTDVNWKDEPHHSSTHILTEVLPNLGTSSPGYRGVAENRGYHAHDDGRIPSGRIYYLRYSGHSYGWRDLEDIVKIVKAQKVTQPKEI